MRPARITHRDAAAGRSGAGAIDQREVLQGQRFPPAGWVERRQVDVPGGKLSYEIMIGLQRSVTNSLTSTSGVNALVNTALNAYLGNNATSVTPAYFLGLNSATPLVDDTMPIVERSKVLTVAPFELKYTLTKLGRFRPYALAGLGGYVWIGSQNNSKNFASSRTCRLVLPA